MSNQSTSSNSETTRRALYDAYLEGMRQGLIRGALMMASPGEKNRQEFRKREIAARLREYAANRASMVEGRKYGRFWPVVMPGGWPIPPGVPDDDGMWPEVDGWPCPPPALRGEG